MATNKKGFVLYCDLIHTMEHLTLEQRGQVITYILEYTNDQNPEPLEGLLQAVVEPIKQQLKRDLKKYEDRADRARENGKKGGRPKTQKTQSVNSEPKKPDSVNVSVNDNENVNLLELNKNTVWREQLLKHHKINLEEYTKHLNNFINLNDLDRSWKEVKTHWKRFLNVQDKKIEKKVVKGFGDIPKEYLEKP